MLRERTDCRCCRGTDLIKVFDLGEQPYANAFLTADQLSQPEATSPLTLMECAACGHVQLKHIADVADMYRDYSFLTSSSGHMVEHFSRLMEDAVGNYVSAGGLVVEIGSNDGSALASIQRPDVRRLGVDPAENLAEMACSRGVHTVTRFFNRHTAYDIECDHGPADLIVACNVLAHIDDLDDFCRGIDSLLSREGAMIVEVPNVERMIEQTEFGQIYHEHLNCFGIGALITLFRRNGLRVEEVEPIDVHGGSIRVTVRHMAGGESLLYPHPPRDWAEFNEHCNTMWYHLIRWMEHQRDAGKTVWGYCAAAKATVLLNYCGIGCDLLPVIVDNTPLKQGRYMPGTHQLIRPPTDVLGEMPDAILVLAGNHFAEVMRREAAYTEAGGKIINPRHLPNRMKNQCENY